MYKRQTIHNGHVGDEYDIPSKEFLGYEVATQDKDGNNLIPENRTGKMTAQKIVVKYYYNQPAKVIVHYICLLYTSYSTRLAFNL